MPIIPMTAEVDCNQVKMRLERRKLEAERVDPKALQMRLSWAEQRHSENYCRALNKKKDAARRFNVHFQNVVEEYKKAQMDKQIELLSNIEERLFNAEATKTKMLIAKAQIRANYHKKLRMRIAKRQALDMLKYNMHVEKWKKRLENAAMRREMIHEQIAQNAAVDVNRVRNNMLFHRNRCDLKQQYSHIRRQVRMHNSEFRREYYQSLKSERARMRENIGELTVAIVRRNQKLQKLARVEKQLQREKRATAQHDILMGLKWKSAHDHIQAVKKAGKRLAEDQRNAADQKKAQMADKTAKAAARREAMLKERITRAKSCAELGWTKAIDT